MCTLEETHSPDRYEVGWAVSGEFDTSRGRFDTFNCIVVSLQAISLDGVIELRLGSPHHLPVHVSEQARKAVEPIEHQHSDNHRELKSNFFLRHIAGVPVNS